LVEDQSSLKCATCLGEQTLLTSNFTYLLMCIEWRSDCVLFVDTWYQWTQH